MSGVGKRSWPTAGVCVQGQETLGSRPAEIAWMTIASVLPHKNYGLQQPGRGVSMRDARSAQNRISKNLKQQWARPHPPPLSGARKKRTFGFSLKTTSELNV